MSTTVVLASGNPGKLRELADLLSALPVRLISQNDLGVADPEETGFTFVENALIKARNAAATTGHPAIADDSGIAVDALNGAPGIYSARYAGVDATDEQNLNQLLTDTEHVPDTARACRFICCAVYLRHERDPLPIIRTCTWEGQLLRAPVGDNGFGYDPIFYVPTHQCSSAELPGEIKNQISHRAQAIAALTQDLHTLFSR